MDNRPVLESDLVLLFECWTFCHGRRQIGWGPSPISIADLFAALDFFEVFGALREDWVEILVTLDQEYLAWVKRTAPKAPVKKQGRKSL